MRSLILKLNIDPYVTDSLGMGNFLKKDEKMERRSNQRKYIQHLDVERIVNNETLKKICNKAQIVDTSINGFLLLIARKDLLTNDLKGNLTLDVLKGMSISLYMHQMELELDGVISLTRHKGKGMFEVLVNFSSDTPRYWRECLIDLLPQAGELD